LPFAITWIITTVVVFGLIRFAWLQLFGIQPVTETVNRETERTMLAKVFADGSGAWLLSVTFFQAKGLSM
jgi:hypothetical protein